MALSQDRDSVLAAGHQLFDMYWKFPFYAKMFADAGFPLTASQMISDSLIDSLIVSGNEDTVARTVYQTSDWRFRRAICRPSAYNRCR